MSISENLLKYQKEISSYNEAHLLAVSKTKSNELILEAYNQGHRDFGENKVQELLLKSNELKQLCPDIRWHFIGSLQSNKINNLLQVSNLVSIHSIDSIKLLNKLLSKKLDRNIKLFIQVNTSFEDEKSGFKEDDEVFEAVELINKSSNFSFQGLMTIGKIRTEDFEKDAKISFRKLNFLKEKIVDKIQISCELSMGMSSDYKIALDMNSNWIRIGSGIFGKR